MYAIIQTKSGNNYIIETEAKAEPKTGTEIENNIDTETFVELIDKYVITILMSSAVKSCGFLSMFQNFFSSFFP